jgi:hypothetical protein
MVSIKDYDQLLIEMEKYPKSGLTNLVQTRPDQV